MYWVACGWIEALRPSLWLNQRCSAVMTGLSSSDQGLRRTSTAVVAPSLRRGVGKPPQLSRSGVRPHAEAYENSLGFGSSGSRLAPLASCSQRKRSKKKEEEPSPSVDKLGLARWPSALQADLPTAGCCSLYKISDDPAVLTTFLPGEIAGRNRNARSTSYSFETRIRTLSKAKNFM